MQLFCLCSQDPGLFTRKTPGPSTRCREEHCGRKVCHSILLMVPGQGGQVSWHGKPHIFIQPRVTKHSHNLREVTAETAPEMVKMLHVMEKGHSQLSSLPLCSWRDLCWLQLVSTMQRLFRSDFLACMFPRLESWITQQPLHYHWPFLWSCFWTIQTYRRFNS